MSCAMRSAQVDRARSRTDPANVHPRGKHVGRQRNQVTQSKWWVLTGSKLKAMRLIYSLLRPRYPFPYPQNYPNCARRAAPHHAHTEFVQPRLAVRRALGGTDQQLLGFAHPPGRRSRFGGLHGAPNGRIVDRSRVHRVHATILARPSLCGSGQWRPQHCSRRLTDPGAVRLDTRPCFEL